MQFEILAPAGSMESLIAGVRCGAHAVYLGGQTFNARRGAGNFSPQELQAAVQYCHTRGVNKLRNAYFLQWKQLYQL